MLSACAPQGVREQARGPEMAARQAVALEPGPPPPVLINPDLLWRSAKMLELKKERLRRSREGLQPDSTTAADRQRMKQSRLPLLKSRRKQMPKNEIGTESRVVSVS